MSADALDLDTLEHNKEKAQELLELYKHFDCHVDKVTLHTYFNFKNKSKPGGKDTFSYKIASLKNDTELKQSIIDNVIKKTISDIESQVVMVSDINALSDRANTISFLNNAEQYDNEQMKFLTGIVFDAGFGGDGEDDIPVVNFDTVDQIAKVDSIIFVLSKDDDDQCITIYKKQYPIQNLSRKKNNFYGFSKTELTRVDKDMISIDGKASLVFSGDTVFIYDQNVFERFFGYKAWIKNAASEFVDSMSSRFDSFVDLSKFTERVDKDSHDADAFSRKLAKVYARNETKQTLQTITNKHLQRVLDENEYLAGVFKYKKGNDTIRIETHNQQDTFIAMVSEGVLRSLITGIDYLSLGSKRKIPSATSTARTTSDSSSVVA
ncbi:hypothetical protein PLEI_3939 [Photobacterium leiognathi lrivu.4.1]|uniref:DUF4868 domain-containing protein n=1 Tax=Photobacterium leiognathi lrivu.4.1 TaxID=1248232 RepID=V5F7W0_PHOLE|nr:Kiwa anti-phage protein KwaB-like domain-containing protein [Photobacterium leiognathi]GAD32268.1 hypothetical protein PLEI_3939 [Photobacterium leiognathi lrivu.4.1]